jgi:hypothetical protein
LYDYTINEPKRLLSIHVIYYIGIPTLRLDVCSESEIRFTCTVNETSTLRWGIDFSSGQVLDRLVYLPADPIGHHLSATNRARGTGHVIYHFNLTSKSPLTSTMSTSTPTDLSGATVSCSNGAQSSANAATLALNGKLNNHYIHDCLSQMHVHALLGRGL